MWLYEIGGFEPNFRVNLSFQFSGWLQIRNWNFHFFPYDPLYYTKMHQKNVGREKFEKKVLYCPPLLDSNQQYLHVYF